MSRQPGRVRAVAVGFFLFVGIFLFADFSSPNQVVAEAEEPQVIAEYCVGVWSDCSQDPLKRDSAYAMTRLDLGNGYYEDFFSSEGRVHWNYGMRESTWRIRTYRGLLPINSESRLNMIYPEDETIRDESLLVDENQISVYSAFESEYLEQSVEEYFARLLAGDRVKIKSRQSIKTEDFACAGPEWCSRATQSRLQIEDKQSSIESQEWIPRGEEVIELPDGELRTLVFDNLDERIWYDPESEQIVRAGSRNGRDKYRFDLLRIRSIPEPGK